MKRGVILRITNVISERIETCVQSCSNRTQNHVELGTIIKLSIGAVIVGLGFLAYRASKFALANFDFKIVGYGKPTISNLRLTVPIVIKFTNPTPIPISLDQVLADIYINKNGQYVKAAQINQPINIPAGTTNQNIFPVIDLNSIFGGNVLDTINSIASVMKTKVVNVRTDVTTIFKGIALPRQTFIQDVPLT